MRVEKEKAHKNLLKSRVVALWLRSCLGPFCLFSSNKKKLLFLRAMSALALWHPDHQQYQHLEYPTPEGYTEIHAPQTFQ